MNTMKLTALWPSVIAQRRYDLPGLHRRLRELAYEIKADTEKAGPFFFTRRKTNCFRDYSDPALTELGALVCGAIRDYLKHLYDDPAMLRLTISGWPMVQPYGQYVPAHHHIGSHLAVCYYVDVPPIESDPPMERSGALMLHDPRPSNRDWEPSGKNRELKYFMIDVAEGLLVIFPGYLMHSVHPWYGKGDRVMYAMNINLHKDGVDEPAIDEAELLAGKQPLSSVVS